MQTINVIRDSNGNSVAIGHHIIDGAGTKSGSATAILVNPNAGTFYTYAYFKAKASTSLFTGEQIVDFFTNNRYVQLDKLELRT